MTNAPLLDASAIRKSFPGVRALWDVDLTVAPGEVVAVVGENGAGKSTLLKILCGDYRLDEGHVTLDGVSLDGADPGQTRDAGFRLVRQEPEIVPFISALENVHIGELQMRGRRVDFVGMRAASEEVLRRYGFVGLIDLDAEGRLLSPAQMQLVEVLRALKPGAKVVAFDEPTSSLTVRETERLFDLIRKLQADGIGVIYVSHRMHEILEIATRVVVLKDGRRTGDLPIAETDEEEIVRLMVGRDLGAHGQTRTPLPPGEPVLEIEGLSSRWHDNVSLTVHAGEIVGLGGLVGAGRTELAKVVFGDLPRTGGIIRVAGKARDIRKPSDAIDASIGLAPEDRKGEGLILVRTVMENACMAVFRRLSRRGLLRRREMEETVAPLIAKLDIKTPSMETEVGKLSGGNQQKVVLARWLAAKPRILILDEPTRAVDVGAKAEIYRLMDELAREGLGILMISSEMPELLAMSDRIVVMSDGRLSDPIPKAEASEERVIALALGNA